MTIWDVSGIFYYCFFICLAGKFDEVYSKLVDANPNMVVFKKEDIPKHFHYQHNIRIMPILIEAKEGWTIMQNRTGAFMCTYSHLSILVCGCTHEFFFSCLKQQVPSALLIASQEIFFSY